MDALAELSLEELGNIQVTSVSKRAERLSDAAAPVFVISNEDIRRAGVTSLPEALRLAPNLEVARITSYSYSISARGFNNAAGNKLQVLIDGRILYTPLFSGVFWDTPDVMLEDVERIEVISGPGATLWGTNAVNGVINVITRRASATQGALVSVSAGDFERTSAVRVGGQAGTAAYRIYGKFFERDATLRVGGASQHDGWNRGEVGFRADWGTAESGFTLQGAAYRGVLDTARPEDLRTFGTHLAAHWARPLASGGSVRVNAYFDRTDRDIPGSIRERLKVHHVEFLHNVAGIEGHNLVWGISHRGADDRVTNAPRIAFLPAQRTLSWSSIFAQDEIALRGDALKFIGGIRVAHNSYTGIEVLPTMRLAWKPSASQLAWVALTRAVRTPSRIDRELFSPDQPPFAVAGGPDFRSEIANVLEVGYRSQPTPRISYSVAVFHQDYDHLRTFELSPTGVAFIANGMEGTSTGIEAWGTVQVTRNWRLSAGATLLDMDLRLKAGSADFTGIRAAGNDPEQQWVVRSSWNLPWRMELDASVRHVGLLPDPKVPAYTAVDARLGWRPNERFELSLTGQNLLDARHVEFGSGPAASDIEREFRVGAKWSF
ncbi:TonB-dependent receptor plug domain-containing protein [Montanilutibacter psychrotolerans]|uniref:TonB-dependent receptor n=1 Tax=Montanilutibacter psychrotolerans TaxID=1327343 RepID=A0A3M8T7B2_9GAMM|nr:TonB-dependent receptor [Lysobacter psychrotolerans]RNF86532.1 TonB-dependent receptor [Lysobacter psychrotolerans]